MEFKTIFLDLIRDKELNPTQFAKIAGFPITTVSGWLNQGKLPDYNALKKMALFFDVSPALLLGICDEWGNITITAGNVSGNNNTVNSHNVIDARASAPLSSSEAELLKKYKAAPIEIRKAVDKLLS